MMDNSYPIVLLNVVPKTFIILVCHFIVLNPLKYISYVTFPYLIIGIKKCSFFFFFFIFRQNIKVCNLVSYYAPTPLERIVSSIDNFVGTKNIFNLSLS